MNYLWRRIAQTNCLQFIVCNFTYKTQRFLLVDWLSLRYSRNASFYTRVEKLERYFLEIHFLQTASAAVKKEAWYASIYTYSSTCIFNTVPLLRRRNIVFSVPLANLKSPYKLPWVFYDYCFRWSNDNLLGSKRIISCDLLLEVCIYSTCSGTLCFTERKIFRYCI